MSDDMRGVHGDITIQGMTHRTTGTPYVVIRMTRPGSDPLNAAATPSEARQLAAQLLQAAADAETAAHFHGRRN